MATLGTPAIPGVRALALRDVQVAIDRIRERFGIVESVLATASAQAGQSSLVQGQANASISNLQRQISILSSRIDALVIEADVETKVFRADVAVQENDVVYASSDTGVSPAVPADPLARYGMVGVATQSAGVGGNVVVRLSGTMTIAGAVFEIGGPVYVGLDGLTQFPDYVNVAIPVGVAVASDMIEVSPGWPALQYPGVYSEYETFLPATWGLVRAAVETINDLLTLGGGLVVWTGADFASRALTEGAGIEVTNPEGITGDPEIAVAFDGLPAAGSLAGDEVIAVSDGGVLQQTTAQDIADLAPNTIGFMTLGRVIAATMAAGGAT